MLKSSLKASAGGLLLFVSMTVNALPRDYWPANIEVFAPKSELALYSKGYKGAAKVSLYEVDKLQRTEDRLSDLLPERFNDPSMEAEAAKYMSTHHMDDIMAATPDMIDGWSVVVLASKYGLERVPATVFDGHLVVYGMALPEAIREYQQYRYKQSRK